MSAPVISCAMVCSKTCLLRTVCFNARRSAPTSSVIDAEALAGEFEPQNRKGGQGPPGRAPLLADGRQADSTMARHPTIRVTKLRNMRVSRTKLARTIIVTAGRVKGTRRVLARYRGCGQSRVNGPRNVLANSPKASCQRGQGSWNAGFHDFLLKS